MFLFQKCDGISRYLFLYTTNIIYDLTCSENGDYSIQYGLIGSFEKLLYFLTLADSNWESSHEIVVRCLIMF